MKSPKVRISTGRISIVVEMESHELADWHATQLASMLFRALEDDAEEGTENEENAPDEPDPEPEEAEQDEKEELRGEEPAEELPEEEPVEGTPEEEEVAPSKKKVRGFVYIQCAHCGKITGRCLRSSQDCFICPECGEGTELDELRTLTVQCECGKRFVYHANMKDEMFDINCLECGAPVAVKWNEKKGKYETIGKW